MGSLPGSHSMNGLAHCRVHMSSLEYSSSDLSDLVAAGSLSSVLQTSCFDPLHTLQLVSSSDLYSSRNGCSQESQSILLLLRASCYSEILRSQHQSSLEYWVTIHCRMFELVPISGAHGLGIFLAGPYSVPKIHIKFPHLVVEILESHFSVEKLVMVESTYR